MHCVIQTQVGDAGYLVMLTIGVVWFAHQEAAVRRDLIKLANADFPGRNLRNR